MRLRADTRARSLGGALLLWGLGLLGALFVLSIVVGAVISIISTVVAVVTTIATALLLVGIAYLAASWALGGGGDDRRGDGRRQRHREYDFETTAGRRTGDARSSGERGDDGSILGRIPGFGSDGERDDRRPTDPVDRLTDQYVRGEIGEAEYERRVERHLENEEAGRGTTGGRALDREYER